MPQYQGIWTLAQAAQLQSTQRWATDPLFENTTLLLQADNAANGAQNNTFLDSSSNNFTITRNGNTTQGTFTPFSQSPGWWSTFFSSSYLTLADSADWVIDTDYTIEFWAYASSFPGQYNNFINQRGGVSSYWGINYDTSLGWSFFWNNGSGETKVSRYQDSPLNTWVHVAIVKSGTTGYMFLNGVQAGATFTFGSISDVASVLYIGAWFTPGDYFNGYLSNLRLVKGRAVYTSNFTPSTIPLGATSGGTNPPTGTQTKLLMSQSNYFIDNSPSPKTISIGGGTPSVQAFSPFAPQYQYTPSVTGGSGYFDGTGDYLTVPDNAAFTVGSGDYTLEAWVYPTASPNQPIILGQWSGGADGSIAMMLSNDANRYLRGLVYSGGYVDRVSTSSLQLNAWNHCAFVREGTYLNLYLNGTRVENYNWGSSSIQDSSLVVSTGASSSGSQPFQGNISNARFVKGTALYSGTTYTIPTAPLTAVTNTQLLLNFTNAGIYDGTLKNNLETVGNAQVSTSVVKYGTGSMSFVRSPSSYLVANNATGLLSLGTGDWTVEAWVYMNTLPAANGYPDSYWIVGGGPVNLNTGFDIAVGSTNLQVGLTTFASLNINVAHGMVAGTWYHIAIVRFGPTLYAFKNGVQIATANVSGVTVDPCLTGLAVSAAEPSGATSGNFNGYIDDLRITKGIARYTANFIPPSVALPRQ